jgi:proteasome accessory factor C
MPGDQDRLASIRHALDGGNALHITYYTATRDETTERVIDPMRVLIVDGRSYLEAWCRRAEAVRLFRIDRIDGSIELDEPAVLPRQAQHSDLRDGVFRASPDLPLVTLRIGRGARWITEYYPCEEVIYTDSECWLVRMRVSDLAWARRFVLGLGSQAVVAGPPELADAVRAEVNKTLAIYGVE